MANPWDADEIVRPAATGAAVGGNPWDQDEIITPANDKPLELDIVGGTPESQAPKGPAPKGSLFRMDSDFGERSGVGGLAMMGAAAKDMFGSRKGAAEYLAEQINKDKGLSSLIDGKRAKAGVGPDGEPVVILPDGTSYRLNDDGIDSTDVANVAGNVAAFFTPAAWATRLGKARNIGLAGRTALQATVAGATDVATQATFDRGRVDPMRAALSTLGGGAGEVIGSGLGRLASRAGEARRSIDGSNVADARKMAADAGIQNPAPAQVTRLADSMTEVRAGADPRTVLGRDEFGFTYTQGQRATDPGRKFDLLSREEVLRQSSGGNVPFEAAARGNADQLDTALAGITERAGVRPGAAPAEMAQGAASRLTQQADALSTKIGDAYKVAGEGSRTAIASDAVRSLPQRLRSAVSDYAPDAATTPVTARTLEQVKNATDLILSGGNVSGVTLKALETQRRIINNNIGAATNRSDRKALMVIKSEFDGWMDEAIDTSLISGDKASLDAIKEARGLRAEFGRRFEGGKDSDKFIAGLLDGSRTAEELVNIALGAGQVTKSGGARFIERLRVAADGDPEVINSLKAAHLMRMMRGADGKNLAMGQIVRNIRSTEYSNASVVKALYPPQEWDEIRRLASSLEPLVAKGDFAKSSGSGERVFRMLLGRVGGSLWVVGDTMKAIGSVRSTVQASRAVNQPLRLPGQSAPAFPATGAAGGSALGRDAR